MTTDNLEAAPRTTKRDKVMSRAEVAAFFGVSVGAVDAYCRQEKDPLPFRKVGRRVLFSRSAVDHWFEDRENIATSARGGPRD
jgi:predicted DNA-binding transcriptional regulator AlpA